MYVHRQCICSLIHIFFYLRLQLVARWIVYCLCILKNWAFWGSLYIAVFRYLWLILSAVKRWLELNLTIIMIFFYYKYPSSQEKYRVCMEKAQSLRNVKYLYSPQFRNTYDVVYSLVMWNCIYKFLIFSSTYISQLCSPCLLPLCVYRI